MGFADSERPSVILLDPSRIDQIVARAPRYLVTGLFLIVVPRFFVAGQALGILTGVVLFCFGLFAFVLRRWSDDRGLWMLAAFLQAFYAPLWAWWQVRSLKPLFAPAAANQAVPQNMLEVALVVDSCTALMFYTLAVRFLASVVVFNWRFSVGRQPCENGEP